MGPKLVPIANTTAFTPSARPRSAGGKASAMIARPGAKINAPPRPCIARATTSIGRELAAAHSTEPSVKSARPVIHTGLRPTRSDSRPNVRSVPAITTR